MILRPYRDEDAAQRASLGRRRDMVRAMGGNISSGRSMTQASARKQINRRFGPGPHWTVADPLDQFLGLARLAPIDAENSIGTVAIALFDPDKPGQTPPDHQLREWKFGASGAFIHTATCLLYTSPSPRDRTRSRMPSSA